MPLYEYQCDACGHRFEVIQKFSDPLVEICPKCGEAVRKLFSSPAIQFKGSGWYITDYARKSGTGSGSGSGAKGGEGGSAAGDSGGSKDTDAKKSDSGASSSASGSADKTPPKAAS